MTAPRRTCHLCRGFPFCVTCNQEVRAGIPTGIALFRRQAVYVEFCECGRREREHVWHCYGCASPLPWNGEMPSSCAAGHAHAGAGLLCPGPLEFCPAPAEEPAPRWRLQADATCPKCAGAGIDLAAPDPKRAGYVRFELCRCISVVGDK